MTLPPCDLIGGTKYANNDKFLIIFFSTPIATCTYVGKKTLIHGMMSMKPSFYQYCEIHSLWVRSSNPK